MIRIIALLAALATPAMADEPPAAGPQRPAQTQPAPKPEADVAVHNWGETHPDCAQWSDSCVVCTKAGCSTPGIACTPAAIVCRR